MTSSKPKKPTFAQLRVLRNLADGRGADAHCQTMSDHGGLTGTIASLYRRGWLADGELTEAGRSAAGINTAMSDYLIPWVGRYFHCDSGHVGIERPTDHGRRHFMPWESVSTEGLVATGNDASGYAHYCCKSCGMPMLQSSVSRLAAAGQLKPSDTQRATLPSVGDRVWHVFLGTVRSGLVSKVVRPREPLVGYAAVFVSEAGGTCCVHGANPAITADEDQWYWTEAEAQAIVDAEAAVVQRRREIAAREAAAV